MFMYAVLIKVIFWWIVSFLSLPHFLASIKSLFLLRSFFIYLVLYLIAFLLDPRYMSWFWMWMIGLYLEDSSQCGNHKRCGLATMFLLFIPRFVCISENAVLGSQQKNHCQKCTWAWVLQRYWFCPVNLCPSVGCECILVCVIHGIYSVRYVCS